jgi:hypothetical protein
VVNLIAISISDVHSDPLGPDRIRDKNVKLNQEWIEIENVGDEPFKLNGRVLIDQTPTNQNRHRRVLSPTNPDFALPTGTRLRIFTGKMDDPNDPCPSVPSGTWRYFLDYGNYIWNNSGDTAKLYASEDDLNAGRKPLAQRSF